MVTIGSTIKLQMQGRAQKGLGNAGRGLRLTNRYLESAEKRRVLSHPPPLYYPTHGQWLFGSWRTDNDDQIVRGEESRPEASETRECGRTFLHT